MYKKLANVLRWMHIVLVTLVIGSCAWFVIEPSRRFLIIAGVAIGTEVVCLVAYKGLCFLTVWEYRLRVKADPDTKLTFEGLIPQLLKMFLPERFILAGTKCAMGFGAVLATAVVIRGIMFLS